MTIPKALKTTILCLLIPTLLLDQASAIGPLSQNRIAQYPITAQCGYFQYQALNPFLEFFTLKRVGGLSLPFLSLITAVAHAAAPSGAAAAATSVAKDVITLPTIYHGFNLAANHTLFGDLGSSWGKVLSFNPQITNVTSIPSGQFIHTHLPIALEAHLPPSPIITMHHHSMFPATFEAAQESLHSAASWVTHTLSSPDGIVIMVMTALAAYLAIKMLYHYRAPLARAGRATLRLGIRAAWAVLRVFSYPSRALSGLLLKFLGPESAFRQLFATKEQAFGVLTGFTTMALSLLFLPSILARPLIVVALLGIAFSAMETRPERAIRGFRRLSYLWFAEPKKLATPAPASEPITQSSDAGDSAGITVLAPTTLKDQAARWIPAPLRTNRSIYFGVFAAASAAWFLLYRPGPQQVGSQVSSAEFYCVVVTVVALVASVLYLLRVWRPTEAERLADPYYPLNKHDGSWNNRSFLEAVQVAAAPMIKLRWMNIPLAFFALMLFRAGLDMSGFSTSAGIGHALSLTWAFAHWMPLHLAQLISRPAYMMVFGLAALVVLPRTSRLSNRYVEAAKRRMFETFAQWPWLILNTLETMNWIQDKPAAMRRFGSIQLASARRLPLRIRRAWASTIAAGVGQTIGRGLLAVLKLIGIPFKLLWEVAWVILQYSGTGLQSIAIGLIHLPRFLVRIPIHLWAAIQRSESLPAERAAVLQTVQNAWNEFDSAGRTFKSVREMMAELNDINALFDQSWTEFGEPRTYEWVLLRHQVKAAMNQLNEGTGMLPPSIALETTSERAPVYGYTRSGEVFRIGRVDLFNPLQLPREAEFRHSRVPGMIRRPLELYAHGYAAASEFLRRPWTERAQRMAVMAHAQMLWDFATDTTASYATYSQLVDAVENLRTEVNMLYERQGKPNTIEWVDLRDRIERLNWMTAHQPFSRGSINVYNRTPDWEHFHFSIDARLTPNTDLLRGLPHESDLRPHGLFDPFALTHEHIVFLAIRAAALSRRFTDWWRNTGFNLSTVSGIRVFGGLISLAIAISATLFAAASLTSLQGLSSGTMEQFFTATGAGNTLLRVVALGVTLWMFRKGRRDWIPKSGRRIGQAFRSTLRLNTAG